MFENAPKFMFPVFSMLQTYEMEGFVAFLLWVLVNFSSMFLTIGASMIVFSLVAVGFVMYRRHFKQPQSQKHVELHKEQSIPLKNGLD